MHDGIFPEWTQIQPEPKTVYRRFPLSIFDEPFLNEALVHAKYSRTGGILRDEIDEALPELNLSGFIFHAAHCGSTLLSRMLSASGTVRTINESEAINGLLLSSIFHSINEKELCERLRTIVCDYLRYPGQHSTAVFKLSSWNAFFLPLFLLAFPEVPWIYIQRDEASQIPSLLERGSGFVNWWHSPTDFLLRKFIPDSIPLQDQSEFLRQMNRLQLAIAEKHLAEKGKIFHYPAFTKAFETEILPHFSIDLTRKQLTLSTDMLLYDAKSSGKKSLYAAR